MRTPGKGSRFRPREVPSPKGDRLSCQILRGGGKWAAASKGRGDGGKLMALIRGGMRRAGVRQRRPPLTHVDSQSWVANGPLAPWTFPGTPRPPWGRRSQAQVEQTSRGCGGLSGRPLPGVRVFVVASVVQQLHGWLWGISREELVGTRGLPEGPHPRGGARGRPRSPQPPSWV